MPIYKNKFKNFNATFTQNKLAGFNLIIKENLKILTQLLLKVN